MSAVVTEADISEQTDDGGDDNEIHLQCCYKGMALCGETLTGPRVDGAWHVLPPGIERCEKCWEIDLTHLPCGHTDCPWW